MSEISVEFGGWFDVTLEMEKVYHTGEYNIYTLFYEDLKLVGDLYTVKFTPNLVGVELPPGGNSL